MDRYIEMRLKAWLHRPQPDKATMDIPELGAACGMTIGQVRKENQDRMIITRMRNIFGLPPTTIFAVCDGMGGMMDGRECAENTLAVLLDSFVRSTQTDIKARLRKSILEANEEVFRQYKQRGGSTVAVICKSNNRLVVATVGDTRIFSLTAGSILKQISVDDTIAGELNRNKGFNTENPNLEPFANQLAQFVGIGSELEPRVFDLPIQNGVSYFIASDGAYNIGNAFEGILVNAPNLLSAVNRIIATSSWMGGKDNATIICIQPDRREFQNTSSEITLEFWDGIGKVELIPHLYHEMSGNKQTSLATYKESKNNTQDSGYKTPKKKEKTGQQKSKSKKPNPIRQPLEIEFGKSPAQDTLFKDSDQQMKPTPEKSNLSTIESKGKANESDGSHI